MNKTICYKQDLCTGCTACANVCPKNCIKMEPNIEGFLYPVIDESKCIGCNLCEKTCPVNNQPTKYEVKCGYVARYKDLDIVDNSTSGGLYSAFADYTFSKNGLLYGVGYNDDMLVRHFAIKSDEKARISEMRGSKYVQSFLGDTFKQVKKALDNNEFVCFSGTPCQIAGLKSFLKNDYDNLITVDLVCHGVSSPLVFKKYVEFQSKKFKSKPKDIRFRNKTYGYHSGTMMVEFENGKKYYGSGRIDHMLKAYFGGACSRKSCYNCPFKGIERCSDFTVFDSWHIEKLVDGQLDDDRGNTNIYVHTEKGKNVFAQMQEHLNAWNADISKMKRLDGVMIDNNPKCHPNRDLILSDINNQTFYRCMQKYLPITLKDKIIEKLKALLYKMGLFKLLKK